MRAALALVLIALGALAFVAAPLAAIYLVALGCAMNTTGCNTPLPRLVADLIASAEVLYFVIPMAVAAVLVWVGLRLYRR